MAPSKEVHEMSIEKWIVALYMLEPVGHTGFSPINMQRPPQAKNKNLFVSHWKKKGEWNFASSFFFFFFLLVL